MKDQRRSRSVVVLFLLPRRQVRLGGQRHALNPRPESKSVVVLFLLPRRQVRLGGQRHALNPRPERVPFPVEV